MKRHYVTLFDSKYLLRGLALYESLCNTTKDFVLYIICFDDLCYNKLIEFDLKNAKIISLQEFEDEELLSVKSTRSAGEYCWTSTAKSILYVFNHEECMDCTYIDSDLYFFEDPELLFDEIPSDKSVLITEHRYTPEYDQTMISGKYCVQFMYFRNDQNGRTVLEWWKDRCIEWCYAKPEDGKLGDQKYLDDWMDRFEGVYELQNLGVIAPWNIQQYKFMGEKKICFYHVNTGIQGNVIFYHFHNLKFYDKDVVKLTSGMYRLPESSVYSIYREYVRTCDKISKEFDLINRKEIWRNEEKFLSDTTKLNKSKNYFRYTELL